MNYRIISKVGNYIAKTFPFGFYLVSIKHSCFYHVSILSCDKRAYFARIAPLQIILYNIKNVETCKNTGTYYYNTRASCFRRLQRIRKKREKRMKMKYKLPVIAHKFPVITLATVGVTCLIIPLVSAQNKTLADVLGLTKEQRIKFDAIEKKYQPKAKAIMAKYEPQIVPIRQKVQAMEKKYEPRITAIRQEFTKEAKPLQDQAVAIQNKANLELKPIEEARRKELEALLTPAQREKVKKIDATRQKLLQDQLAAMKKAQQNPAGK